MILANIESLVIGIVPMPSVVTLRQVEPREGVDENLVLPILIGPMESSAIAAALDGKPNERPLTHKLANDLVKAAGGAVSRVVIDRVEGATFYCTVYLRLSNGMFTRVDARPSDGIALAIRANAPLFITEDVMHLAGTPRSFMNSSDKKIELEEFDKFIEKVEPEDFLTHYGHNEG